MKRDGIKVEGHRGTWYIIDELHQMDGSIFLLEHEQYGDEASCIIINGNGDLLAEDITDGIREYLERMI